MQSFKILTKLVQEMANEEIWDSWEDFADSQVNSEILMPRLIVTMGLMQGCELDKT